MDAQMLSPDDLDRVMFFESAREKAAADYARNPRDADNLTRWGGALLELAQFQQGHESITMVEDAESKLEEALKLNPKLHNTLWCLGNAHTSHGFLLTDAEKANILFTKASRCFQLALEEDPRNELYKQTLEMSGKAPSMHGELQKHLNAQEEVACSSSGRSRSKANKVESNPTKKVSRKTGRMNSKLKDKTQRSKKKKVTDLKYDVLGWIVLAVGVCVWIGMAQKIAPS